MKKSLIIHLTMMFGLLLVHGCKGTESDEGNNTVTYLTVTSEGGNEKLLGKTFVFKVQDNLTNDVTPESQIYVNDQLISGNTYAPTEKGAYTVKAKYRNLPINPISINAIITDGTNFKHRILYEDFTGTWCGYCTVALARHDNLAAQTEDFVFMGIHGPDGTTDPWSCATSTEMETFKNVSQWPTMYINRTTLWPDDSNYTDMSIPLGQLSAFSKIGIKMNSTVSGNTVSINTNTLFAENFNNLKISAFMVEDGLIHNQKNYISTLYGGSSYVYNYVHHNVLRNRLTSSVAGETIPDSQTMASNEYSRSFQYTIPSGFNSGNLKIILMILDGNGKVLNVREAKIGTSNNYEFI